MRILFRLGLLLLPLPCRRRRGRWCGGAALSSGSSGASGKEEVVILLLLHLTVVQVAFAIGGLLPAWPTRRLTGCSPAETSPLPDSEDESELSYYFAINDIYVLLSPTGCSRVSQPSQPSNQCQSKGDSCRLWPDDHGSLDRG